MRLKTNPPTPFALRSSQPLTSTIFLVLHPTRILETIFTLSLSLTLSPSLAGDIFFYTLSSGDPPKTVRRHQKPRTNFRPDGVGVERETNGVETKTAKPTKRTNKSPTKRPVPVHATSPPRLPDRVFANRNRIRSNGFMLSVQCARARHGRHGHNG